MAPPTARLLAARWVLPISDEPIEEGAVLIEEGRIAAVGPREPLRLAHPETPLRDFGRAIILPGLVNAHCHLDYTVLRERVAAGDFASWIQELVRQSQGIGARDWLRSAELGVQEMLRSGITCIGDTTRTGAALAAASRARLRGVVFREVFGLEDSGWQAAFDEATEALTDWRRRQTERLRVALSPHAPYTASGRLISEVARFSRSEGLPFSMHVAESEAESSFLRDASGPLAAQGGLVRTAWPEMRWQPPGLSPLAYLESLGALGEALLAAHCVQANEEDVARLAASGTAVVHCPRSNLRLGNGIAPVAAMLEAGVTVALGTDSAASSDSLDMFSEMRFALLAARARGDGRRLTEREVLEMATIAGARALGWSEKVGSLEAGKEADVTVVSYTSPWQDTSADPYATLVRSCQPSDVRLTMVAGEVLFDGTQPGSP